MISVLTHPWASVLKWAINKETYVLNTPKLNVGNLIMGERYIEPSGTVEIKNTSTGDTCSLTYKNRGGFFTNSDNINAIDGVIKNSDGKPVFRIFGKFTDKIEAQNLETKEKWIVFTAPEYPENSEMMYNMNYWSL